jgi:hypothetical protein
MILLAIGCDRDDSIRVYQAPKESEPAPTTDEAPATQSGEISVGGARMTVPASWQRQPDQQMRVATFRAGEADVIITRFGAESFVQLLPNVNRWRGQVGLEPLTDEKQVTSEELAVGNLKLRVFDFIGPQKRARIAVINDGPAVWYFKIQGTADAVAKEQPAFDAFLRSIQLGS